MNAKQLKDTEISNNYSEVNEHISSIKNSIANAYLFNESSLSPLLQMYFMSGTKLEDIPRNQSR